VGIGVVWCEHQSTFKKSQSLNPTLVVQFLEAHAVQGQNILWVDLEDVMKDRMGFVAQTQDQKRLGLETQPKTPTSVGGVQVGGSDVGFH
jgi:hypothetical protein